MTFPLEVKMLRDDSKHGDNWLGRKGMNECDYVVTS